MSDEPKKWWQWFLVYPVLLTSIIAAIPTYIEAVDAIKYDVEFGKSDEARQQDDMWKRNLSCASAPIDPLTTSHNIEVDATICKTGDVLVRIFAPDNKRFYKWVAVNQVINEKVASMNWLISTAHADTGPLQIAALPTRTLCQKYLGPGRVLRRVKINSKCYDEIINTYTGRVERTNSVKCSSKC